jgi:hypothetical protein
MSAEDNTDLGDIPVGTPPTVGQQAQLRQSLGLGSIDNTADADKPIATAAQAALDGKATTAQGALADSAVQPGDDVEFASFIPPAGTTAEIDAVTTAEIGSVIWDTDKQHYVRFNTASTYQTLTSGGGLYLNDPDIGSTDYVTTPQTWATGGIIADQPLATSSPIAIKRKGWSRITLSGILEDFSPPQTSGDITVNVSGSARIKACDVFPIYPNTSGQFNS